MSVRECPPDAERKRAASKRGAQPRQRAASRRGAQARHALPQDAERKRDTRCLKTRSASATARCLKKGRGDQENEQVRKMKLPTRISFLFFVGVFIAGSTALGY